MRIPRVVHITRQQVLDQGFDIGTRFRVMHGVFEGEEGVITNIRQQDIPVFGDPYEVTHTTTIEARLDSHGDTAKVCIYNPDLLERVE